MRTWTGRIALEGVPTIDGRMLTPGALRWTMRPKTLYEPDLGDACGQVDKVWRHGNQVFASGVLINQVNHRGLAIEVNNPFAFFENDDPYDADAAVIRECDLYAVAVTGSPAWVECFMVLGAER